MKTRSSSPMHHIWPSSQGTTFTSISCCFWYWRKLKCHPFDIIINWQMLSLWHNSAQLHPTLCGPTDCSPPVSSVHRNSPDKNTGAGCHFLFQGVFPTQGLNLCLLHCQVDSLPLSHLGNPWQNWAESNQAENARKVLSSLPLFSALRQDIHSFLETDSCQPSSVPGNLQLNLTPLVPSLQFATLGSLKLFSFVLSFLYKCIVVCWKCYIKWKSLNRVQLFATPWTIQSMEFSR